MFQTNRKKIMIEEMEISDLQFDSHVGGSETISNCVNVSRFIKNRMEEVIMLTETIKETPFKGQTFQRLPKHMRRRQMSHHVKRLPRKLQRPYLLSLKESLPIPPKRPSRKYRRRPSNLLTDYNRRQQKFTWLETHIWHAKRFHMVDRWGYKLPLQATNKSFKFCYRALSEHCLLIDTSYYNCIELSGPEKKLLEGLKQCTSTDCGLTFGANIYIEGMREGSVTLFHANSYPTCVIGNVTFMWQPKFNHLRKIWIWTHPLMHEEVVLCFLELFNLKPVDESNEKLEYVIDQKSIKENEFNQKIKNKKIFKNSSKSEEMIKLIPKNVPFDKTPKFNNKDVTMALLKNTLNRFQLRGPMAQAIVTQAFNVIAVSPEEESEEEEVPKKKVKIDKEEIVELNDQSIEEEEWWKKFYQNKYLKKAWVLQKDYYDKLCANVRPSDVPPEMILSLVIEDPRLKIPSKREKALPSVKETIQTTSHSVLPSLSQSPIWDPEIRDRVSMTKLSTYEINIERSRKIVPGINTKNLISDNKQSRIPILLVQAPGNSDSRLGLGSGWDIIAPVNFGMPIWLSLVFRGSKAGGLRELNLLNLECSSFRNCLPPDSAAGEAENQRKFQELRKRHFELPPNKRPNFIKLGVPSPFYPLWKILVRDWVTKTNPKVILENSELSVLRNKKLLYELSEIAERFSVYSYNYFNKFLSINNNYLVPVVIEMIGKGNPTDLALICLPNKEDLNTFIISKVEPNEPSHSDKNEKIRSSMKLKHQKLLKSLKRKRRKMKSGLGDSLSNERNTDSASSEPHSDSYNSKMRELWLPDFKEIQSIIDSASRELLGYVTTGGFSMSRSCGLAMGYVCLYGLVEAFKVCKDNKLSLLVLVRNKNETQYRFGKLKIFV